MFGTRRQRRFWSQGVSVVAAGTMMVLSASPASAKPKDNKRSVCAAANRAYTSAVDLEKSGHLHEAGDLLSQCAAATVCGAIASSCQALADKVIAETPTIVAVVMDEKGNAKTDVDVKIDGNTLASELDGRALVVEAGLHEFTFSSGGNVLATEKIMVLEGQRNRPITLKMNPSGTASLATAADLDPDAADAPAKEKSVLSSATDSSSVVLPTGGGWRAPRSAFPYVLGGVGLAAVAAGGLLTYWGTQDNTDLQNMCKPNCSRASVDHIQTMYIAADVSFGAGAAALAITTWLFAKSHAPEQPAPSATRVEVHPTASGAFASVSGAF